QLATAMSAIANGGTLLQPHIVRRVGERGDVAVRESRRRVVPERIARLVSDMMTSVTGPSGTGPEAAIDGYLVAGKTGTAQKADTVSGGYSEDRWLASFAGFVPAQDPRLVISVVIDEPALAHYGGVVAGPVFRRVGEAALRHLGVPAATGGAALARHRREQARRERQLRRARREGRLPEHVEPAMDLAESGVPLAPGEARVPGVVGSAARAALVALSEAGFRARFEGSGLVVRQTPRPGAVVAEGAVVRVDLAPAAAIESPRLALQTEASR
ncbi:MAG: penicillin-binding transpeptidase domain-containing protein, partial [Myxococcota bacterium]